MKVILLVLVPVLLVVCVAFVSTRDPSSAENIHAAHPSCWDRATQETWAEPQATFTVDNTSCTLYYIRMGRNTPECTGYAGTWGRFVRCKDGTGAHVEAPDGKFGWH